MKQPILIDGKECAKHLKEQVAKKVMELKKNHNITPGLAVILVGNDYASEIYINIKLKRTKELGMNSYELRFPEIITTEFLINKINELNKNPEINGILVQLPLPKHIDQKAIINSIDPLKDVDGFHPTNIGKLWTNQSCLVPCTPQGCMLLLEKYAGNLAGKNAVVVGRSNIVGKPMASLLLHHDCTVTIAHSKTQNIEDICKQADILISAVGKPQFIKASWVKEGAVVIDVGINRTLDSKSNSKLVGDVDFDSVKNVAKAITPVPGGVGPMTIACLMKNTLLATHMQNNIAITF